MPNRSTRSHPHGRVLVFTSPANRADRPDPIRAPRDLTGRRALKAYARLLRDRPDAAVLIGQLVGDALEDLEDRDDS